MFFENRQRPLLFVASAVFLSINAGAADPIQAVASRFTKVRHDFRSDSRGLSSQTVSKEELFALGYPVLGGGHYVPGSFPLTNARSGLPKVFAPSQPRQSYTRYPWKLDIVTTVFWVGELPTRNNPTPNTKSAWDRHWTASYGGYDDPDPEKRDGLLPGKFLPGENPFYFALPYNDISKTGTKASARAVVPWFKEAFYRNGRTVLKGRWIAIRRGDRVCYAQWEDVGPFEDDDWEYVFGDERPKAKKNRGAGLDVSPAVRDYLDFGGGYGTVDWRFVDVDEVPDGPWKDYGANNPFANASLRPHSDDDASETVRHIRTLRDRLAASMGGAELDGAE